MITIEQQAGAILEKWVILLSLNKVQVELIEDTAIKCSITEVEAIINYAKPYTEHIYDTVFFVSDVKHYQQILEHLKKM